MSMVGPNIAELEMLSCIRSVDAMASKHGGVEHC